jgi:hypothetical protein
MTHTAYISIAFSMPRAYFESSALHHLWDTDHKHQACLQLPRHNRIMAVITQLALLHKRDKGASREREKLEGMAVSNLYD